MNTKLQQYVLFFTPDQHSELDNLQKRDRLLVRVFIWAFTTCLGPLLIMGIWGFKFANWIQIRWRRGGNKLRLIKLQRADRNQFPADPKAGRCFIYQMPHRHGQKVDFRQEGGLWHD